LGKSCCVSCLSKNHAVRSKERRITVSVFLSTLQLTALLLKSFRLHLHSYTLLSLSFSLSLSLSFSLPFILSLSLSLFLSVCVFLSAFAPLALRLTFVVFYFCCILIEVICDVSVTGKPIGISVTLILSHKHAGIAVSFPHTRLILILF